MIAPETFQPAWLAELRRLPRSLLVQDGERAPDQRHEMRLAVLRSFARHCPARLAGVEIDLVKGGTSPVHVTAERDLTREEVATAVEEAGYELARPGSLPLAATPTKLRAAGGAIEISGYADDLTLGDSAVSATG